MGLALGFIAITIGRILLDPKSSFSAVTWTWNWSQGILLKQTGSKKEQYPFSEFEKISLILEKTYHSGSRRSSGYYTHNGYIQIQQRGQYKPSLEVASTGDIETSTSTSAYKSGVAFTSMLSQELDIPVEFIDKT